MSTPKNKCEICGFEDECTNQPDGVCQDCGSNYSTMKISLRNKRVLEVRGKKGETFDQILRNILNDHINRETKEELLGNDNLLEIIKGIRNHMGHGTESNPEQYGDMFFNILKLSKVPTNDLQRYSNYVIGRLKMLIEEEVKNNGG